MWSLTCIYLMTNDFKHSSHLFIGHLFIFFYRNVCSSPLVIFFIGWSFYYSAIRISKWVLYASSLLAICLSNVLPHSVDCIFTFLMVSFEAQKFLILMNLRFSFSFSCLCFGFRLKNVKCHCQIQGPKDLPLCVRLRII